MSAEHHRPVVTVVVPALNAAPTIAEQLEALADQCFEQDWEVLVVDNGSTDGTGEIARSARRHHRCAVRVVTEPRRGLNVARNAGVRAARADRIAICDADDVVDEAWLRMMVDALREADLVGGGLAYERLNDDNTRALRGWERDVGPASSVGREFGYLDQLICGNVAFHLHVWHSIGGFDERFERGGDDVDFSWRAQLAGFRTASQPNAILHYRGRASRRSLFRQYVRDGQGAAHLYAVHRRHGMPRRSAVSACKSIVLLAVRLPTLPLLDLADQGHLIRAAGKQWGRILGSLKHKVVYL